jgi:magnesium chelatase family protein
MLATARSVTLTALTVRPIRVEVETHRGIPSFTIVGKPDAAVRESRERVRAALINSGFEFPLGRIVVNLAPASLRSAPSSDLAIAVALLTASAQVKWDGLTPSDVALIGELALDGTTRPVYGALLMAEAARDAGAKAIVVPAENAAEAALAEGIRVIPLDALTQVSALAGGSCPPAPEPFQLQLDPPSEAPDLADLRGQPHVHHALEVAAAGGHSLLMVGSPGSGKSLAAGRLPSILPSLVPREAIEIARISGAVGRFGAGYRGGRPFRAPHHTISPAGLVGGGTPPMPGEVTLAHGGVLYLDELHEFRRDALDALQVPLQTGRCLSVTRPAGSAPMPARALLLAAAIPCPCGRGPDNDECVCSPAAVQRHRSQLAAILPDHIDLLITVSPPTAREIAGPPGRPSAKVRQRVVEARSRQESRLGEGRCNADMTPAEARACIVTESAALALALALADFHLQRRLTDPSHRRIVSVAQTLADLDGTDPVTGEHVTRAVDLARRNG